MKYLIGLDLDGTLLTENKVISNYNKEIIKKLIENGHEVFLVTGRSYDGAISYYKELNLKTPLITLNGAYIINENQNNITHYFDQDFYDLFKKIEKYILTAVFNSPNKVYAINHDLELERIFNGASSLNVSSFDKNLKYKDILNGVFAIKDDLTKEFEKAFENEKYGARYWGTYNGIAFYDIHRFDVSKASAIKELLKIYNLDESKLITFGDGVNDLEMLSMTKNSVAMQNASKEVKIFANNTTDYDNDNDGVGKYLFNLLLK